MKTFGHSQTISVKNIAFFFLLRSLGRGSEIPAVLLYAENTVITLSLVNIRGITLDDRRF